MKKKFSGPVLVCGAMTLVGCGADRPTFGTDVTTGGTDGAESDGADSKGQDGGTDQSATDVDGAAGTDTAQMTGDLNETDSKSTDGEGTDGTSEQTDVGAGEVTDGSDSPGPQAPAQGALGSDCSTGQDCESTFCVDGVCCDSPCTGVCAACDSAGASGTCSPVNYDEACGEPTCADDSECRTYALMDGGNCTGMGQCSTSTVCAAEDVESGTRCQSDAGMCDGAGECVVPNKAMLGASCANDDECGSGFCATTTEGASVCCNQACDGTCQACGANGFCDQFPADDTSCSAITCDPDTTCADYPSPLSTNRCAGFGQCVTEAAYCTPTLASTSTTCGTGMFCDLAGTCSAACTGGQTWCTDRCVDVSSDEANCGACGEACPNGTLCVSGSCECPDSGESLCSGSCLDLSEDVDNCGTCGNSCGTPSQMGSTRACLDGTCGGCGANGQSCCDGASACSSGMTCSGGTCNCPGSTHYCEDGPAAGTCADDDAADACGVDCVDCAQANAVAQCISGACQNTCLPDVVQLCPGTLGRPVCGSWDFETGSLQGWSVDTDASLGATGPARVANIGSNSSHSLSVDVDTTNSSGTVRVYVPLCATTDLSGKKVRVRLRFESAGSALSGFAYFTVYWSGGVQGSLAQQSYSQENAWIDIEEVIDSGFEFFPDAAAAASGIGFTLSPSNWEGTIYFDNIQLVDD